MASCRPHLQPECIVLGAGELARKLRRKDRTVDGADQAPTLEPSPWTRFTLWKNPEPLDVDSRHLERKPVFIDTTGNVML